MLNYKRVIKTGNRLKLDWTLSSDIERSAFLEQYMQSNIFVSHPPTDEELETMANYVLWGKDVNGFNSEQRKEVQLPRRNSTWSKKEIESIDGLLEDPAFPESSFLELGSIFSKPIKQSLSREELRKKLSPTDLKYFEDLWRQIDYIELKINFFEIARNKRSKPPRKELFLPFTENEIARIQASALKLNQFQYLKLRHLLVELRREQYPMRDAVLPQVYSYRAGLADAEEKDSIHEEDLTVLPLGTCADFSKIFAPFSALLPSQFRADELNEISSYLWKLRDTINPQTTFDFRDLENVYQLLLHHKDLQEDGHNNLINTFWYYAREADLTPIQSKVLKMKMRQERNQDIAAIINKEFNKRYTDNYISTIFRQKIIPAINCAATYHERLIDSIFFEEDFKICGTCGRLLLRDPVNFVRRSRAKDGFSNRCKKCDKAAREAKRSGK